MTKLDEFLEDYIELAKNLAVPISMILLWMAIAYALVKPPFPLNYILGLILPVSGCCVIVWRFRQRLAQWELDDKKFPALVKRDELLKEAKERRAKAEARRG